MSSSNPAQPAVATVTAQTVIDYLREHADFFVRNAQILPALHIPHGCGDAASIIEAQVNLLRRQNRTLTDHLQRLTSAAEHNEQLGQRIHRLSLALLREPGLPGLVRTLERELKLEFSAKHAVLRLFRSPPADCDGALRVFAQPDAAAEFADVLASGQPRCGVLTDPQRQLLFASDVQVGSAAVLPLAPARKLGVLVLTSDDPNRFHTDAGTLFLAQLADMTGLAVNRCLTPEH